MLPRCLSPCHLVTLSPCHLVTLSPCHLVTLSPCHLVTLSPCHLVTLSPCHLVTLSPCHLVTLSPCHLVTLSPPHRLELDHDHHHLRPLLGHRLGRVVVGLLFLLRLLAAGPLVLGRAVLLGEIHVHELADLEVLEGRFVARQLGVALERLELLL